MKLYEINSAIEAWEPIIDEQTGEVVNYGDLEALNMAREEKLENIACYILDLEGDAEKIREQERVLATRRRETENKAKRLREYLGAVLNGEKLSSPRVAVSWRRSTTIAFEPEFIGWAQVHAPDLLRYKEPEPDKKAIAEAIHRGADTVQYAHIEERNNMQIK